MANYSLTGIYRANKSKRSFDPNKNLMVVRIGAGEVLMFRNKMIVFSDYSSNFYHVPSRAHWIQSLLIINSWPHQMKGGREFQTTGIKEGGERVINVTRINP